MGCPPFGGSFLANFVLSAKGTTMAEGDHMGQATMLDVRERAAVLALVSVTQGKWHETASMLAEVRSAIRFLRGDFTGLESFDREMAERLARQVPPNAIDEYATLIEQLEGEGVHTITVIDPGYPANLRAIFNMPPMLFVRGALHDTDARAVAIVGTREASPEGLAKARELAADLSSRGITILSGMARGIDSAAHEGALEAGGRTIAVLGTGIHRVYPRENEALAQRIEAAGALVSQFWPDAPPTKFSFPMRNVVMSGMAIGTVVVEAGSTSGAKMQARFALEHGKRVFLLESLVMRQDWAKRYQKKYAGVTVVKSADKIADLVEQLVRPPQQLALP